MCFPEVGVGFIKTTNTGHLTMFSAEKKTGWRQCGTMLDPLAWYNGLKEGPNLRVIPK